MPLHRTFVFCVLFAIVGMLFLYSLSFPSEWTNTFLRQVVPVQERITILPNGNFSKSVIRENNDTIQQLEDHSKNLSEIFDYFNSTYHQWNESSFPFPLENVPETSFQMLKEFTAQQWEDHVFKLARENLVSNKYLVLNVASYGHIQFVLNWIYAMHRIKYTKFLIVCLDDYLYLHLSALNFTDVIAMAPSQWLEKDDFVAEAVFGSASYHAMIESRSKIIYSFLNRTFTVLSTDSDVVWLSPSVIDYLDSVTEGYDFSCMVDHRVGINMGFFLARPTSIMLELFLQMMKKQNQSHLFDQYALEEVLKERQMRFSSHIFRLDKLLFPSGKVYFLDGWNKRMNIQPLVGQTHD